MLGKFKMSCSTIQNSDPYENAVAERVIGILKQEFILYSHHLDLPIQSEPSQVFCISPFSTCHLLAVWLSNTGTNFIL